MLGDFGLAYLALDFADEIEIGLKGTPKYMSPEALTNAQISFEVHAKSDVWLVLIYILCSN